MNKQTKSDGAAPTGSSLYIAELLHRIANEYASAISALRNAAARASSAEAQSPILETVQRLNAFAAAHVLLRPPVVPGQVDFACHLTKLCRAVALARFKDRPITLSIRTAHPIMLDPARSWRAALVVSELITNSARHAFGAENGDGEIVVNVAASRGQIVCAVNDTGAWETDRAPGLGSSVNASLAAELGGQLVRRSDRSGTSIELSFPERSLSQAEIASIRKCGLRASTMLPLSRGQEPILVANEA